MLIFCFLSVLSSVVSSKVTTDQKLFEWTNTFPLQEADSQTTQCDGAVEDPAKASQVKYAGKLAGDTTYCASTVVPKSFTEHY